MPQQTKLPPWTKQHDDALSGLVGLKIPKKEARKFVEGLQSTDVNEMIRQALAARTRSQRPSPAIPGGPQGAVPIHPQPQPPPSVPPTPSGPTAPGFGERTRLGAARLLGRAFGAQSAPSPQPAPRNAPLFRSPEEQAAAEQQSQRDLESAVQKATSGWRTAMQAQPPQAPIQAAAAQIKEKPRIRMPLVSRRVPPAPIGGGAPGAETAAEEPTKEKAAPLPLISSKEEYQQLAPGTEFIWKSDGHVYEKPKEEAQGKTPA
jgi:hypothetical protein